MKITRSLFVCFTLSLIPVAGASTIRTVALTGSGSVAPGTGGANFSALGTPVLNDAGQTAFNGTLTGTGVNSGSRSMDNNRGIWSEGGGEGLALIARSGNSAPGTGGANFYSNIHETHDFSIPALNNRGQVTFLGLLSASGVGHAGIWSEGRNGELNMVARSGEIAPVTNGSRFSNIGSYSQYSDGFIPFNDAGQTAFFGSLSGGGGRGIWSGGGSSGLTLVARSGVVAPGTGGALFSRIGNTISIFRADIPFLNNQGQTVFQGSLTGEGVVNGRNHLGIWSEGGGNGLALVARAGDVAPGTDGARYFAEELNDFGTPAFNDAGQTAFSATLTDTDPGIPDYELEWGIWSEGSGNGLALIAHSGEVAPGTDGDLFSSLGNPALNNSGEIAFLGGLSGTNVNRENRLAIWSEGQGNELALVARMGDLAPGAGRAHFSNLGLPVLNDWGQSAFSASLNNGYTGIWAEDRTGVLRLIAKEGGLLDINDGPSSDFRQIERLSFLGSSNGTGGDTRLKGFNDQGQVVFRARFTDGTSGIFVSNLVAVPEPGALVLLGVSSVGLLFRRKK